MLESAPSASARLGQEVAIPTSAVVPTTTIGGERPSSSANSTAEPKARSSEDAQQPHGLCGQVLLPNGLPAVWASVCFGSTQKVTDSNGRFCFTAEEPDPGAETFSNEKANPEPDIRFLTATRIRRPGRSFPPQPEWSLPARTEVPLVARMSGYGPACLPDAGALLQAWLPSDPPPVTLVLSDETWAIGGSLEDQNGQALNGWTVEVRDASVSDLQAQESCGGGRLDSTVTDELGFFSTQGLLPGSYSVRAYDSRTLASVEQEGVLAGTEDLALRARTDVVHPLVRGRVVSWNGTPLQGVSVSSATCGEGFSWNSKETFTDSNGTFELEEVPAHGVCLRVQTHRFEHVERIDVPEVGMTSRPVSVLFQDLYEIEGFDPLAIEIVVNCSCYFELELGDGDWEGLSFCFRDENGREVLVHVACDGRDSWIGNARPAVLDAVGKSCRVGENARTLCLFDGDQEIDSRPVRLEVDAEPTLRLELP